MEDEKRRAAHGLDRAVLVGTVCCGPREMAPINRAPVPTNRPQTRANPWLCPKIVIPVVVDSSDRGQHTALSQCLGPAVGVRAAVASGIRRWGRGSSLLLFDAVLKLTLPSGLTASADLMPNRASCTASAVAAVQQMPERDQRTTFHVANEKHRAFRSRMKRGHGWRGGRTCARRQWATTGRASLH